VVTEVTQQETVIGTTEILRNPNYGHSLTVIYYQILRHLAVSTEFAGARECLFVPFAIKPFTLQRLYRWREAIQRYLRQSRFHATMKYLRDVITNFEFSNMAPGARSQQKLTYLQGSVYLTLAVDRPSDIGDAFDPGKWMSLSPLLGSPAMNIWAKLAQMHAAHRDDGFQREHAPTIAAKWVNTLQLQAGGADVHADFTLATRYAYNQTVRVDFNVPVSEATKLDRARLSTMVVKARVGLPGGSVAKVTRLSLRYGTANFQRTLDSIAGADDVLNPGNAQPDAGAQLSFPLDAWDQVDERKALINSINELLEHLNEHVEFYHKAVWWSMDRDRLFMMLDGFYVPGTNKVSIASVVDREPVAIIGNSLVYRVGAGTFIGHGKITTPVELYNTYAAREPVQDPLLISLPTEGLYAQTIMDECLALEEHAGSVDWVLEDPDPELGAIDPALLASRRADSAGPLAPTAMPATIINLQNAPDAPAPAGLADALNAAGNAGAFRDMAGLAGTQSNAIAALNTASSLATHFGDAAAVMMAELAKKAKATEDVNKKIAAVKKAKDQELISTEQAAEHSDKILGDMHSNAAAGATDDKLGDIAQQLLDKGREGSVAERSGGAMRVVDIKPAEFQSDGGTSAQTPVITLNTNMGGAADGRVAIFNFGTFIETNRFKSEAADNTFFDTDVLFNADPGPLVQTRGVSLVQDAPLPTVFSFNRMTPTVWKSKVAGTDKYRDLFKAWIDEALQDPIDCMYCTGHHWARDGYFMLSLGDTPAAFHFTGRTGTSIVQIGVSGARVDFDVAPLRDNNKLIFGYGCDVATAEASTIYQQIFGRGADDVPIVCGWNTTIGVPTRAQEDRSPNVRFFAFLEEFATANSAPATGRLQWFYDNHPMELVRAWGHATQLWYKSNARARGKDGKLYKFKLVGGKIEAVEATS
jgi:hypothetical protein